MRLIHHSPYTLLANGVTEIKQQRNSTERRPKGPAFGLLTIWGI